MTSSDEFATYPQPPPTRTASKGLGAGPSSKRKTVTASPDNVGKSTVEPIQVSSTEEEEMQPAVSKREATARPTTNGKKRSAKGKGKASTGAPRRKKPVGDVETPGETPGDTDADVGVSRLPGNEKERDHERLHAQLVRLQKKLDDVVQQRDRMSSQLDEVFRLRQDETESLLVDQKAQYEARLKAQDDTIQELRKSLSRSDALSRTGAGTSLHFLTREMADEEKQNVQREVNRLKKMVKEKDNVIDEKEVHIKALDESIKVLRADLKTEIENTKALTSRNPPSSGSKHNSKAVEPKHAMVIRLYEELTGIWVTNVRHEPGQYKEDDAVYTCVLTTSNNTSLNFTLKFFQEQEVAEGENLSSTQQNGPIVEKVIYTPHMLEQETPEFVAQLDFLASPFTFQKAQMSVFTKTLTSYLEGENEDNSDGSQMEVEED